MTVIPLDDALLLGGFAGALGLLIGYALCMAIEHIAWRRIERRTHEGPSA